jgi:hypothetical protein
MLALLNVRAGFWSGDIWFALNATRPLACFAGIWTTWTSVRKVKEGETINDIFAFLTTEPNAEVGAIHPKAMPVILTTSAVPRRQRPGERSGDVGRRDLAGVYPSAPLRSAEIISKQSADGSSTFSRNATICSASSGSGRCSFKVRSAGAVIQVSTSAGRIVRSGAKRQVMARDAEP